jgi:hypothetical protein
MGRIPKKWLRLRKLFVKFLFIPPKFLLLLSIWNNIKEAKQKLQIHRNVIRYTRFPPIPPPEWDIFPLNP